MLYMLQSTASGCVEHLQMMFCGVSMHRLGDDDPRAGPSSMQRFAGEDLQVPKSSRCCAMLRCQACWQEYAAAKDGMNNELETL